MSITAKELAKKLNISEAAVSMALNNKRGVSTKTRIKVMECAKENGYDFSNIKEKEAFNNEPNGSIIFMIYKRNGIVVDDTPFFSKLSEGISQCCKENNYTLTITYMYQEDNLEKQIEDNINLHYKGAILLGTEMNNNDFAPFNKLKIPLVVLDTFFENINNNYVLIDNVQGANLATNHLIRTCKSQPGYLKSKYPISNFAERTEGFYKAIRKNGMPTSKSIVHALSPSADGAYADMLEYIKQKEDIAKCYFADNDLIAAGAIKAFKEAGYSIPEDISILGFDDMPHCTYIEPQLTTIRVPKIYFGTVATKRLLELIEFPTKETIKILVNTSLVPRKSVSKFKT